MTELKFKELFWETFLEFQRSSRKTSVTIFARHLTQNNKYRVVFSQQLVSGWLNGEFSPSEKYAPALAEIMGDHIYDYLNIPRPDPDLQTLTYLWPHLTETARHTLREQGEKYAAQNDLPSTQSHPVDETT